MTLRNPDREAVAHGHITNEPIRQKPGVPSWVLKLIMAVTGLLFALFVAAFSRQVQLQVAGHVADDEKCK